MSQTFYDHINTLDVYLRANDGDLPTQAVDGQLSIGKVEKLWRYVADYQYILPSSPKKMVGWEAGVAKKCGTGPQYENYWSLSFKERSRLNEDKTIYERFFKGRNVTDGSFVELGAFDGKQESNSNFFETCLGWKGLLIEGNPENFVNVMKNRPFAYKMSFAPSCQEPGGSISFYMYPLTNVGLVDSAKTFKGKPTVDVPCGPLGPVLEDVFEGKPIRFFSLDVEGAEKLVLDTIDFEKVHIDILMIEIQNRHCQNEKCKVRQDVRAKMKEAGYTIHKGMVHASDVYVHPQSEFQLMK